MNPFGLKLTGLNQSIKGPIQFLGDESKNSSQTDTCNTTWSFSQTGSFHKDGLKINVNKGIESTPNSTTTSPSHTTNHLKSLSELEFICPLGAGAAGTVYKAFHKPTNKHMAIKSIDFINKQKRKQFMDEITLYLTYSHPNIVKFYGSCVDSTKEQLLLALEFCENGSLESFVQKNGTLSEEQCKEVAKGVTQALAYLEFNNIIHRDIKPGNILFSGDYIAKLGDFGITKAAGESGLSTTQVGTIMYMSPERMNGEKYSSKCDVWSMGLSLLYCIYGYFPYNSDGSQKTSLLSIHTTVVDGPPPTVPDKFSMEFRSFIAACLTKDESKRWKASDLLLHPFLV